MPPYNLNFHLPAHTSFSLRIDWAMMEVLPNHIDEVIHLLINCLPDREGYSLITIYFEMLNGYQEYLATENALIHTEVAAQ